MVAREKWALELRTDPNSGGDHDRRHESVRVALVHPGIYDEFNPYVFPPWGVLCMRSALSCHGLTVEAYDFNGSDLEAEILAVQRTLDPSVWGITAKLGNGARRFLHCVKFIRERSPGSAIVVGGPLASAFPDAGSPLWRDVDAILLGDGEEALLCWLEDGKPRGVHGPYSTDLDVAGVPSDWGRLPKYVHPASSWPNFSVDTLHVATARGCTRRCTFCYLNNHVSSPRFRYVSSARLAMNLDALNQRLACRGFYFIDDCFIDHGTRLSTFEHEMAERGYPYEFGCDVQLENLEDLEQLRTLQRIGFRALYVGLESGSSRVRRRLHKSPVSSGLRNAVQRTLDLGFVIRASIGIGWPEESLAEMRSTLAMIDAIPGLAFDAYRYLPVPNTPEWDRPGAGSTKARSVDDVAYACQDFSEFNNNYSSVDETSFEAIWGELVARQDERLASYFATP
jgi:radical SAM superfamily enzyme YgiQ (UPF0313 family)